MQQQERIDFMRAIAKEVTEHEASVLKGGTALLLTRNLDRFSEDMDFDFPPGSQSDLRAHIQRAAQKIGLSIASINIKKDTETTKRYMVHYDSASSSQEYPLKVECSMRNEIQSQDVEIIDGIRTYKVSRLAELKAEAFVNRNKARDSYDVAFLLDTYPDEIKQNTWDQIRQHVQDRGINDLCDAFDKEKQRDPILSEFDGADVILRLQECVQHHDLPNMAEVQAAESKASMIQSMNKSADGMSVVEGQDIGSIEEGYMMAANEVKYEAQQARTANAEAQTQGFKIGDKVVFQPHDAKSAVTGTITATKEDKDGNKKVTLKCGRVSLTVSEEKGTFTKAPSVEKESGKEYAKDMAMKSLGSEGKVLLARYKGAYTGPIIGTTSTFAIQKVNENTAVLHRLKDLQTQDKDAQGLIKEGEDLSIVKDGTGVSISRTEARDRDNDKVRTQQKTRGSMSR